MNRLGGIVIAVALLIGTSCKDGSDVATSQAELQIVNGTRTADLVLVPGVIGPNVIHVTIVDADPTAPSKITAILTPPAGGGNPIAVPLSTTGGKHVLSTTFDIPVAGTWTVTVQATYDANVTTAFISPLTISP